jgi:hypothetical protein
VRSRLPGQRGQFPAKFERETAFHDPGIIPQPYRNRHLISETSSQWTLPSSGESEISAARRDNRVPLAIRTPEPVVRIRLTPAESHKRTSQLIPSIGRENRNCRAAGERRKAHTLQIFTAAPGSAAMIEMDGGLDALTSQHERLNLTGEAITLRMNSRFGARP